MITLSYPLTDRYILPIVAPLFLPDKKYSEKEVNMIIIRALDDYVTNGTTLMIASFQSLGEQKVSRKITELFSERDKYTENEIYANIKVALDDYYDSLGALKFVEISHLGDRASRKIAAFLTSAILSKNNKYPDVIIKVALDDYYVSIGAALISEISSEERVISEFRALFSTDTIYSEKEINAIIKRACTDHVTIRSKLIDCGILDRTSNCNEYWVQNENHYQAEEHRHFGILNIFDDNNIGCIGECYPPWVNIIDPYKLPLK